MLKLNDDDAAKYHRWFATYPVLCHDINGIRKPENFFIAKWLTTVWRRSAAGANSRYWVYCYEDPYDEGGRYSIVPMKRK